MTDPISKLELASEKIDLSRNFRTIPTKTNIYASLSDATEFGRICLDTWVKQGRLSVAFKVLAQTEYKNRFGKPYSEMSIRKYALEFILNHPADARKIYQEIYEFLDTPQADKEWVWHVINIAVRQIKSKQHFIRWALRKNFYKSGFYLFKDLYNLTDDDYTKFDDVLTDDDYTKFDDVLNGD